MENIEVFGEFGGLPKRLHGKTFYGFEEDDCPDANELKKLMLTGYRSACKGVGENRAIHCPKYA